MEFAGTQTDAKTFEGETVFAANGEKVGDVDKVLYDKATGKPEWLVPRAAYADHSSLMASPPTITSKTAHSAMRNSVRGKA